VKESELKVKASKEARSGLQSTDSSAHLAKQILLSSHLFSLYIYQFMVIRY